MLSASFHAAALSACLLSVLPRGAPGRNDVSALRGRAPVVNQKEPAICSWSPRASEELSVRFDQHSGAWFQTRSPASQHPRAGLGSAASLVSWGYMPAVVYTATPVSSVWPLCSHSSVHTAARSSLSVLWPWPTTSSSSPALTSWPRDTFDCSSTSRHWSPSVCILVQCQGCGIILVSSGYSVVCAPGQFCVGCLGDVGIVPVVGCIAGGARSGFGRVFR